MNNFKQPGNTLDFVAPAGGVISGQPELRGTILHIPGTSAKEGEAYAGTIAGVFDLPCATGTAWETTTTVLYWDATNKRVTTTVGSNTKIGFAGANKPAAAARGSVRLLPTI